MKNGTITVAVFSDIHGNYHAFKACYEDAIKHGAEQFVFLGDYVSDLANPRNTMNLVYEIRERSPTVCLRGNRERYMLECEQGISSFSRGSKTGSLLYTYENLRQQDLDFFARLTGISVGEQIDRLCFNYHPYDAGLAAQMICESIVAHKQS